MKQGWGKTRFARLLLLGIPYAVIFQYGDVMAQPLPDSSLPTNTTVSPAPGNNAFWVDGGTLAQKNLFHSFESFSVPLGGKAIFRPNPSVERVFSRVTGKTSSLIEGLLQVEGSADFFLLNPNGVVFGPNASLDLKGSFLATTAEDVQFSDERVFSARPQSISNLLSVNLPAGLQFGQSPGAIVNRSTASPVMGLPVGLKVDPDQTLALIGGPINFVGGHIVSPQSRIEIGSVAKGSFVSLAPSLSGYSVNYDGINTFENIRISLLSRIDSSGIEDEDRNNNGAITLRGQNIIVSGGSQILANNLSNQTGGNIDVEASDTFAIIGTAPLDGPFSPGELVKIPLRSSVSSNILGSGKGADIHIRARQIKLEDGGILAAEIRGEGKGGEISIQASELVEVLGQAALVEILNLPVLEAISTSTGVGIDYFANGLTATVISVTNFSSGQSENLVIKTKRLHVHDGGIINLGPFGSGSGGDAEITAEQVEVGGANPGENYPSAITVAALPFPGATGAPGDLLINTTVLQIKDGGRLGLDTTSKSGALGIINASELVEITGTSPTGKFKSLISGQSSVAGTGGRVELTTKKLHISDQGQIFVAGLSASEGGDVKVVADSILLANQAEIATDTARGNLGGNINLQVKDTLLLLGDSKISAAAGAQGDGGNITITANLIATASSENSDIVASAFEGRGGAITITTSGILGFEETENLTSSSDITASSRVGINGTVAIDAPDVDVDSAKIKLRDDLATPSLAQGCLAAQLQTDSFITTGRSGLPINPISPVAADSLWQDMEPLSYKTLPNSSVASISDPSPASIASASTQPPLTEAQAWSLNTKGKVQLIAAASSPSLSLGSQPNCNAMHSPHQ